MARKKTNTADYFPHFTQDGKTIYMLESKYGNDGYAFWFKLLSEIGKAEDHYLDFSQVEIFDYFLSRAKVTKEIAYSIIEDLCKWKNLDQILWNDYQVIWCQSLVDNLVELYRKRKREIPVKPSFCDRNNISKSITVAEMPHSIVEYSIVKDSIVEDIIPPPPEMIFNYMIDGKEILSIEETFKENFPILLNDLKNKHGEFKIKKWIQDFSELHKQKSWKDFQDFRYHISSFILKISQKENQYAANKFNTTEKPKVGGGAGKF